MLLMSVWWLVDSSFCVKKYFLSPYMYVLKSSYERYFEEFLFGLLSSFYF